jgi:hypothetical protein
MCLRERPTIGGMGDPAGLTIGIEASQQLEKALRGEHARRLKRRAAARILSSELERVDLSFARALHENNKKWLAAERLRIPAWDQFREHLAAVLDDDTWEGLDAEISGSVGVFEAQLGDTMGQDEPLTSWERHLVWFQRQGNAAMRAILVNYAAKPGLWNTLIGKAPEYRAQRASRIRRSLEADMPADIRHTVDSSTRRDSSS